MPFDSRNVSEKLPAESLGSLGGCLVEGDPEQRRRERRVRRRSLVISIFVQAAVIGLLVLIPLFGKSERIPLAITTPVPPYSPYKGASHDPGAQHPRGAHSNPCHFCEPARIPHITATRDPTRSDNVVNDAPFDGLMPGIPGGPGGLIPIPGVQTNVPPPPDQRRDMRPSIVRVTRLNPAMLIHRVEPIYPPLARQIHKEGRVELHAIIADDGSIKSLEAVGGDPMFYQSALDAVSQWHYKPTILNGQAVEIDTHITVIYTMSR